MENSAKEYIDSRNSTNLINYMHQLVEHMTEHLDKENNRLYMIA
jgi:hemerythrin-like domain-containing protein